MIVQRYSFLIFPVFILSTALGNPASPTDVQKCKELCSSCDGTAIFEEGRCTCMIGGDRQKGEECLSRMKRDAVKVGLDLLSCSLGSDRRKARCSSLGSKHQYNKNGIGKIAKYFANDGPITGTVFQAPSFSKAKNSECQESSKIITQPPETMQPDDTNVGSPQPKQVAPQQLAGSAGPFHQIVGSPIPQQYILTPIPQVLSSVPQPFVGSPNPQQFIGSPSQQNCESPDLSPNSDSVGSPQRIITQPKETQDLQNPSTTEISEPEEENTQTLEAPNSENSENSEQTSTPKLSSLRSKCGPTVGSAAPSSKAPIVGAPAPMTIDFNSLLRKILAHQFNQPLLGIPQAINTIGSTPCISKLIGAPSQLFNVFMQRMGVEPLKTSNVEQPAVDETVASSNPTSKSSCDDGSDSPVVGAENPAFMTNSAPPMMYSSPTVGSPFITLFNPTVGVPAPSHSTLMNPMMHVPNQGPISYIPSFTIIHKPMVDMSPHNNFATQSMSPYYNVAPQSYMVGSPMQVPVFSFGAPAVAAKNPFQSNTNSYNPAETVGQANQIEEPMKKIVKQKKICKKSSRDEFAKKLTRDVKSVTESNKNSKSKEAEEQIRTEAEILQKQAEHTTTELPEIQRTTTQKSTTEKSTKLNTISEKLTTEKIEKEKYSNESAKKKKTVKLSHEESKADKGINNEIKSPNEVIKKSKGEKNPEQKADIKS